MTKRSSEELGVVGSSKATPSSREIDQSVIDHIAVMLRLERAEYAPCFDYLSVNKASQANNEHVIEDWRRNICEWTFEVVDHFGFDREVVSVALNYLDRTIAHTTKTTQAPVPRKEFQLLAVTCLYLAIKLHGETDAVEGAPRKLRIDAFVELSRGMFSVETLEKMEREILSKLKWHVNPPTTICFIASLLRLLPVTWDGQPLHSNIASSLFEMARYLTELSVCVSSFSFQFKSSEISYTAILCAIDALRDTVPIPYRARIAFLNAIAETTSLTPGNDNVRKCRGMIMELCPSLFSKPATVSKSPDKKEPEQVAPSLDFGSPPPEPTGCLSRSSSTSSDGGTGSPVCVTDTPGTLDEGRAAKRQRRC